MNHNEKRLDNDTTPTHEDLRESVEAWTREITGKCRAHKMSVAVFLVVVPLDDPKPQWAHNMTTPGALALLDHLRPAVASRAIGIATALPHEMAKRH